MRRSFINVMCVIFPSLFLVLIPGCGNDCPSCPEEASLNPGAPEPLVAVFAIIPINNSFHALDTLEFDATGTYGSQPDSVEYLWDFGDNSTGVGQKVRHVFRSAGEYRIDLVVGDGDKNSDTCTAAIKIFQPYARTEIQSGVTRGAWILGQKFVTISLALDYYEFGTYYLEVDVRAADGTSLGAFVDGLYEKHRAIGVSDSHSQTTEEFAYYLAAWPDTVMVITDIWMDNTRRQALIASDSNIVIY